jgi:hypothetical protein
MSENQESKATIETYQKKTDEIFAALGRFVQAFEDMVGAARSGCLMALSSHGCPQKFGNVVLHHQALTAKPMMDIFRAMMVTFLDSQETRSSLGIDDVEHKDFHEILSQLHTEYSDLANKRNNLLHASWFMGHAGEAQPDFFKLLVSKFTPSKSGFKLVDGLPDDVSHISDLTKRCEAAKSFIFALFICAYSRDAGINLRTHFYFDPKQNKWMYQSLS